MEMGRGITLRCNFVPRPDFAYERSKIFPSPMRGEGGYIYRTLPTPTGATTTG